MVIRHWLLLLACVAMVATGGWLLAQERPTGAARVLSGADIGFRPDPVQGRRDRITGTFVVRVNGAWVDAQFSARPSLAAP
jgi:hypothetical protein